MTNLLEEKRGGVPPRVTLGLELAERKTEPKFLYKKEVTKPFCRNKIILMAAPQIKLDNRLGRFNVHYQLDYRSSSICNLMVQPVITYDDWVFCRAYVVDLITRPRHFNPPQGRPVFDLEVILDFMNGRVDGERGDIIVTLVKAALADNGTYLYYQAKAMIEQGVEATEPISIE